ncbi:hypothetical protein QAD02_003740 [Eretmocerus hayati]|uniref:Uncharacterized protein n=1 Tax=Eretmocerus hayati TaxID=131215 RepID=A0ACC2NNK6_9HYME|nr:hypothetical protein QAD02_003740 [Eretmocerus hayati]
MILKRRILYCLCQKYPSRHRRLDNPFPESLQNAPQQHVHLYSQQKIAAQLPKSSVSEPLNKFVSRTHTCGELRANNVGEKVQLCGWLEFQRLGKFLILRDAFGSTQCIISPEHTHLSKALQGLSYETVLSITGRVVPRPEAQCNPKMNTGDIEINIESVEILNSTMPQLPFNIRNNNKAKESLQMQYRYLALRFSELQKNLRTRSMVIMKMREYLVNQCGFVDVATPTLFRRTPGGAQEFIVPTRHPDKFYSLTQSPQQFKQLLMVGGIDRYFQVAQCYRDEGIRHDRQPEFTQLDIEMSFVDRKHVMSLTEQLIVNSWPGFLGELHTPFECLTYEEAMEMYGSDSPDFRIPGRIYNVSQILKNYQSKDVESLDTYAVVFKRKEKFLTGSIKEEMSRFLKENSKGVKLFQLKVVNGNCKGLENVTGDSSKQDFMPHLKLEDGDVVFVTQGPKSEARQILGRIRVKFVDHLETRGEMMRNSGYHFLWVTDMPLFSQNNDTKALESMHHPFTQVNPEDVQYLDEDPLKVRGLQYDLVLNGSEVGGGSIRIHQKETQEKILKMLNIDPSDVYYLLEALNSGAPPHGGIALGLDRYISILCGAQSIRDVIAFPKTIEGRDLMSNAPASISDEDKRLYHIQTVK